MTVLETLKLLNSTMRAEAEDYIFDRIIKPCVVVALERQFDNYDWTADYSAATEEPTPDERTEYVDAHVVNCMYNMYEMIDEPIYLDGKRIGVKSRPVKTKEEKERKAYELLLELDLDEEIYDGFEERAYEVIEQWLDQQYNVYCK